MVNVTEIVSNYVAVWNEPDSGERRRKIRSLWAPEGTTCYRLLDAHGYDAIEARVIGSWDKWLRDGKYIFRPKTAVCRHDVVKFDWVMVTVPGGDIEATGLSFLVLNSDGRIEHDYQFNPTVNEADEVVDRYLTVWNERDADARCSRIAELWAPDGAYIAETPLRGYVAIEAEVAAVYDAHVAKGFVFSRSTGGQRHHDVATFKWYMRPEHGGKVAAAGSDFLVFDDAGRIRFDYRFDEAAQE